MKRRVKILLFIIFSIVVAAIVDITLVLQFSLITYFTTVFVYFVSGLLINKKSFGFYSFLFLLPILALNAMALVVNPLTFPILSPITLILACLAFWVGLNTKKGINTNKKSWFYYPLLVLTLCLLLFSSVYFTPHYLFNRNTEKISTATTVYDSLEFSNLDGTPFEIIVLKNKTILIDNWFLDCYQCNLKLPSLQSLSDKVGLDSTIQIVSVVNGKIDSLDRVIEFAKKHKELKFQILYDRQNTLSKLIKIDGYPVEIIIDKGGFIKERHDGFNKDEQMIYVNETFKKLTSYNSN